MALLTRSSSPSASVRAPESGAGIGFVIADPGLNDALNIALLTRTDLRAADPGRAAVVIADARPPERSFAGVPHVLLVGDHRPRAGETAIQTLDPALILSAAALLAAGYRIAPEPTAAPLRLSARETEVAALLVEGASNKAIARALDISVHTAKFHVAAVLEKLSAHNRADAVAIILREGLVTL